ncbi:ABC transporter ATP-binding protein [Roseiconus nitratireducens]|nr:ABC transporter ATP-binding protein [Roseiconus nitratireducens]
MSAVQIREISLNFGDVSVLRELDLTVQEGEYLVVLGASGCGKTSLLRMVAGLLSPTSGRIFFGDRDVTSLPPRERDVAFVPQQDGLYPHLTIAESIATGIRENLSRRERGDRVRQAAARVGLESLLERLPHQLSGGQLRRAALAKALARQATVRLLDEPLSAIDSHLRFQIEDDLRQLHQASPGVTLHVTHDGQEALRLADRIAVIEDGRVVQVDRPDAVLRQPSSLGVAAALGASPLHTVRVVRQGGEWQAADGVSVSGPQAAEGTTATLAYYHGDVRDSDEVAAVDSGDWREPDSGRVVAANDLRWFIG